MPKHVPQGSKGYNPFADLIGLSFTKQESGWSKCQLNVEESLLNPYGMLHGGVIYSLADGAMGAEPFIQPLTRVRDAQRSR